MPVAILDAVLTLSVSSYLADLIFIDPSDETPIRNFVQIFGRNLHVVWPVDKLGDVLRELKEGRSHMALVRDVVSDGETDPYYVVKGIITLEGKLFNMVFCLVPLFSFLTLLVIHHFSIRYH